jgi:predicted permease
MDALIKDIRYGLRSLLRRPASTTLAVLALALGIGVNTAIFSVVNSVLLRPLPFAEPERVVSVWERGLRVGLDRNELAPANFIDIRDQNNVFSDVGIFGETSLNLSDVGEPERLDGLLVSAKVLGLLGVQPKLGRTFSPEEDQPGQNKVVVLSDRLWQRRFNRDPAIVGRNVTLDAQPFTVIGVMPEGFFFPAREPELWIPWAMGPDEAAGRGDHYARAIARLKPGVTTAAANAYLQTLGKRLEVEYPRTNEGLSFFASSFHDDYVGKIRRPLFIMLAAVATVLLIACSNVANLLLAHVASRRKEISVRAALGASRWSIVRQFFVESALLGLTGGALGVLVCVWGVSALTSLLPETLSQIRAVNIDARVLLFSLSATLFTTFAFGFFPALQASRAQLNATMKESGPVISGWRSSRTRRALLVTQVALAAVLLVSAGLLIRSFGRLLNVDPGFKTENLLTMRMVLPFPKYGTLESRRAFYDNVLRRIQDIPQVESAGIISFLPLSFGGMNFGFSVEGQTQVSDMNISMALYRVVSPDYFRTMGLSIQGRTFDVHDDSKAPAVVVINRRMANQFWPGTDPIGRRLKIGPVDSPSPWATVIGVVSDVRQGGLYEDPGFEWYAAYAQERRGFVAPRDLVVRTKANSQAIAAAVRKAVWEVDKDQPVSSVRTMNQVVADTVSRERFQTVLLTIFAVLALSLACIGLYGLISYAVTDRTHEIGLRIALGARRWNVLSLVINQGLTLTLIGIVIGLTAAFALTRTLGAMLFEVTPTDPLTFLLVTVMLLSVALLACYVPARRATKIDPLVALRYE